MADSSAPWVEGLTIGEMLRQTSQRFPERDALFFPQFNYSRTYKQLDAEVDRVAKALLGLGIGKGEQIAVWATNWPQWVLLQFASARVGAVLVTINPAYRSHELAYCLKQSDCVALFLIDKFRTSDYFQMLHEAVPELATASFGKLASPEYPKLREVVSFTDTPAAGMRGWSDFLRQGATVTSAELADRERQLQPGDPINIQYTSGTTGFPKGATLAHRNLLLNAYYITDCQKITELDRMCIPVPFYHCFGCVLGVLGAAVRGAAMVVPNEYYTPEATLAGIESGKATVIYGVPTMYIAMLDHPTRPTRRLDTLRTGIMSGSPCPIEVMQRVVNDMGAREITIAYGLTEASPVITQTRTDDDLELRVKTVGRPLPDLEVKVADPATGESLPDGEQGELCVRGHAVMLGYYNMPEQTAKAIDDAGWLHSGDIATRLPNGYFRITGRIKDMVCRGGENIYPREVEEFLYTHPAIQDVAVVGVPDPKYIEELAAWIKLKPGCTATAEEIRAFCQGQLAHYKIPRHVRFVTDYPQTVTGKIQKFKIREMMIHDLNLEKAADREMA